MEFRAFEMPPHAHMNIAQQLLLRALIANFWRTPYEGSLQRFGTALNDRFMLPYFLRKDLETVLSEVSQGTGIKLDPSWFDAQYEFRFPLLGSLETIKYRSICAQHWNRGTCSARKELARERLAL